MGRRYAREKLTEQLVRLLERASIPDPDRPFEVCAVYVYGSYARGALECGDIDARVYLHRVDAAFLERCLRDDLCGRRRGAFEVDVREHLGLTRSLIHAESCRADDPAGDMAEHMSRLENQTFRVVYDAANPDWRANIAAIMPDPAAGRHARATDAVIDLLRTSDTLADMVKVIGLLEAGHLTLERTPVPADPPDLGELHQAKLDRYLSSPRVGKELARLWPHAYAWLLGQGAADVDFYPKTSPTEARHGRDRRPKPPRFVTRLGKPSFREAVGLLHDRPEVEKVLLLPHLRKDGPNELFVLARGPNWIEAHKARDAHFDALWFGVRQPFDFEAFAALDRDTP